MYWAMTNFNGVPTTYTTRWNTRVLPHQDAPSRTHLRKYNTSCNRCRKSRVKCSGGIPCHRCATSSEAQPCVYSLSQRRGKKKAVGNEPGDWQSYSGIEQYASDADVAIQSTFDIQSRIDAIQANTIDPDLLQESTQFIQPVTNEGHEDAINADSPTFTDIMNIINSPPTQSPSPKKRPKCPNTCYANIHELNGTLDAVSRDPGRTSIDEILALFQRTFHQSAQYLACENCDAGCPRHINLAMLHQRQVTLLCEIAKQPVHHLGNDMKKTALGSFLPSEQDDLEIKQLMLRHATRNVKISVEALHQGARGFEERHIAGTLELGDAGKLNLKWLLDVSANLDRRLDCVRVLLERDDWASELKGR